MANRRIGKAYIQEHIWHAAAYGLGILILFILASLYGYEGAIANMSYGLVIIFFFGGVYTVYDFVRYKKKCLILEEIVRKEGARESSLPSVDNLKEAIYQEIISAGEEEMRRMVTEYDEKKRDMADYYTMWIHQIKTPIAAMHLLLEDVQQAGVSPVGKQAEEELFKIEQYAEMALHYARLDSLSSDLAFKKIELHEVVKQAVRKYAVLFIGSGLSFSLEDFSCKAVTDEKWMSFVIEQVLSNAIKYTKKGGISIYGANEEGEKQAGIVTYIVIEDTGIGICKEDLPRIFERGFTGYNGRMDKKSTGIGLYLCSQIMGRLNHTIRVKSKEKEGTKILLGFQQEL
ncbi:MAG: sensor histidine kinase [Lachnospiraceae bacterium]|nr:sensor histidine kinase [Lachnospiraceae bacterium]